MIWRAILSALWRPLAGLLALAAVYLHGRRDARTAAKLDEAARYRETRERMDDAQDFTDRPDAAADWLRERQRSRDLRRD